MAWTRFEKELEFIQLLTNPEYIKWLFQEGYFTKLDFLTFLNYLKYWKDPKYSKFLLYPQCLPILDILTDPKILTYLEDEMFYTKLAEQQHYTWKNRRNAHQRDDIP